MKRSYSFFFAVLAAVLLLTAPLSAQDGSVFVLEYADNLNEVQVQDRNDFEVEIFFGIGLSAGDRIRTGDTGAELRLVPNGSILRLAPDTTFTIDSLQGERGARENAGTLSQGRLRFVAARTAGRDYRYSFQTPGAVAGVRGTDFGLAVIPGADADPDTDQEAGDAGAPSPAAEEAFVFQGEIIFTDRGSGEQAFVASGQGITLGDDPFLPREWAPERVRVFQEQLQFQQLDPGSVPAPEAVQPDTPAVTAPPEPVETPEPVEPPEPDPGPGERFFGRLAEITGMQVGSVTINERTWGQVVFQPMIRLGDFTMALYFPITYESNLFDPDDWFRPGGNNEWSFGTDQDWENDPQGALADLATDLALKIRYVQYRDQGAPFFLKAGSLSSFTIGQGLLMRNYANDTEFPAIRRLGFNMGLDRTAWGLELFVNDLMDPNIYGGRLYFRPAEPVIPAAVGFSAITDLEPTRTITPQLADEIDPYRAAREAEPVFINVAADLEVPLIGREIFSLTGFLEAGALVPYVRQSTELDGLSISSGTKTNAIVDFESGNLRNFGWTGGIRGGALIFDYRLAYQYFDGTFRPGFYGPDYDRLSGAVAAETIVFLSDMESDRYKGSNMGVQGELGATLFEALHLGAGYLWPWEVTRSGSWKASPADELRVFATLREGVIPLGVGAGVEYRRRFFAPAVAQWSGYSNDDLFDANTTLAGHISYPLTDFIVIVARVSTTAQRDRDGDLVYNSAGEPKMVPTVTVQTEIGLR